MHWILFFMAIGTGSGGSMPAITTTGFYTQGSCEEAGKAAEAALAPQGMMDWWKVKHVCIQRF